MYTLCRMNFPVRLARRFLWVIAPLFLYGSLSQSSGATIYGIDQRNDDFVQPTTVQSIQFLGPIGQSFTPTFPSLNFFDFSTEDLGGGSAQLFVNLRQGSIARTILGVSSVVTLPTGFSGVTRFLFPVDVLLVPGTLYVAEVRVATGVNWGIGSDGGNLDLYLGGDAIALGSPTAFNDLFFREGQVPEPSTLLLFSSGLAAVWALKRFLVQSARSKASATRNIAVSLK